MIAAEHGKIFTARNRQVLTECVTRWLQFRRFPTIRELATALGLSSYSTVHAHLTALVTLGFLERPHPGRYHVTAAGLAAILGTDCCPTCGRPR